MPTTATDNGPNHGGLVHHAGQFWKDLADFDAGNIRFDRPELTTDFAWGVRFDFPHILMRRAATQEDVDEAFVFFCVWVLCFGTIEIG